MDLQLLLFFWWFDDIDSKYSMMFKGSLRLINKNYIYFIYL